jgi:hypothetical protein
VGSCARLPAVVHCSGAVARISKIVSIRFSADQSGRSLHKDFVFVIARRWRALTGCGHRIVAVCVASTHKARVRFSLPALEREMNKHPSRKLVLKERILGESPFITGVAMPAQRLRICDCAKKGGRP